MNFIKRDWKAFMVWVRHHKAKAVLFGAMFIITAILYAETSELGFIVAYMLGILLFAATLMADARPLIVLLSLGLLLPPKAKAQEPPEPGGIAVGCAVVVIGGVAVYYMYSFCKKHFPKPDTNQVSHLSGDSTFAACQQSFNGYCIETAGGIWMEQKAGNIVLHEGIPNETIIRGTAGTNIESIALCQIYDREEFQSYLTSLGLPVGQLGTFHAINGQPCEAWQSPIQFTANGITIAGLNPRTNVVERSHDLVEWTPILTNIAPANLKFKFTDNSDAPQTSYRIKP